MILFALVALCALSVPLLGGSLGRLRTIRVRWAASIVAALALQVLIISVVPASIPELVSRSLHLVSYALALGFIWINRRIPWLWLIGAGGLSNLVAIDANGGVMPASRAALAEAGKRAASGFSNSAYHAGEHLRFLGDVFAIPHSVPLSNVYSVGDVMIAMGATLLLHTVCRSRAARAGSRLRDVAAATMVPGWLRPRLPAEGSPSSAV